MKRFLKILSSAIPLLLLTVLIVIEIVLLLPTTQEKFSVGYEGGEIRGNIYTTSIRQGDLQKSSSVDAEVIRKSFATYDIVVPTGESVNVKIGDVLPVGMHVSNSVVIAEHEQGRVVDIANDDDGQTLTIDLASNFIVRAYIPDALCEYVNGIVDNSLNTNFKFGSSVVKVKALSMSFSTVDGAYITEFGFETLNDRALFVQKGKISVNLLTYSDVVYIDISAVKNLKDDTVELDRVIYSYGSYKIESVALKAIDEVGGKVILDTTEHVGENYLVYNKYFVL